MSDKICVPNQHFFTLLIIFLLMTMFYVYNSYRFTPEGYVKKLDNFNYGINNDSLAAILEKIKKLDEAPIFNKSNTASRYPPPDKTIMIKPNNKINKFSKEDALKIITSNKLTDLQKKVLNDQPELVLDTQPRSLIINDPEVSLEEPQFKIVVTNDIDSILEGPVRNMIDKPLKIGTPFDSPLAVPDLQKRHALEKRDVEAVFNDFRAPERRDPEYAYPTNDVKNIINIPTRGSPDNYHSVGVVVRKKDEKVFQLFGRQKYPGSSQWEYYVSGADNYGYPNKMPLVSKGNRELSDKDIIQLPWLDQKNGDFEVNIYNFDVPRYNPYDI